jgi:colanic acid/amylovoran biosynthesis glycosyltransferase
MQLTSPHVVALHLKIAYLVNHYPKVSHSFIRREILALEQHGLEVTRIAVRGWRDVLPDEQDRSEQQRTHYVLRGGAFKVFAAMLQVCLRAPARFGGALLLACRSSRSSDRPLLYHLIYFAEACRIVVLLRGSGVRQLHAHFGTNSTDVAMLVHALGGPRYSFTVHGPEEFWRAVGLREKIARSAFAIAISSFCRSQLYLWSQVSDWAKVHIVRCGIEKSFYEHTPPLSEATTRLVCVGRLAPEKGHLLLLEACAQLQRAGIPFELVFAGDGPLRPELERLVAAHGLGQRVRITGWVSSNQVRAEILAARALVQPSFAEGLPVVLMEAMALRRPVIATYIAGIPELVVQGATGWLVPAGAADALAAAMQDCLSRSLAELQEMGAAARARAIAYHSIETEAGKLAALFSAADTQANPSSN